MMVKVRLEDERGRIYEGKVEDVVLDMLFKWKKVLKLSGIDEEEALDIVLRAGFYELQHRIMEKEAEYGVA